MNKYLFKIAAASKVELEPGVSWNRGTYQVEVSPERVSKAVNKDKKLNAAVHAGLGVLGGGMIGTIQGIKREAERKLSSSLSIPGSRLTTNKQLLGKFPKMYSAIEKRMPLRNAFAAAGALTGAATFAGLSVLGDANKYTTSINKKKCRDELISTMHAKHKNTIDNIEGWK
jgi:hypothetical protein